MAFIFNPNKKRGVFMIPSGATKSPTPTPDPFNNTYSLAFDGVDDFVSGGDILNFERTDAFSISAWVKRNSINDYQAIVSKMTSSGYYRGYLLNFTLSNVVIFILRNSTVATRFFTVSSTTTITDTNWHNIVVTYDGSSASSGVKIYIDGVSDTVSASGTLTTGTTINSAPFNIGARNSNNMFADGNIDETAIFSSELTSENVTSIFNSGVPNDLTSLNPTAWYRNGDNGTWKSPQWLIPNNENKTKFSNYSFSYDGVNDYIDLGFNTFDATNGLTMSCWVKYDGVGAGLNWLCSIGSTGGASSQFNTRLSSSGGWFNYFQGGAVYTGISGLADGNWHHISQTVNYSNGEVKFYKDGVVSSTVLAWGTTYSTAVLAQISTSFYPFKGQIDEFAIFESIENISDLYNSGVPTDISSLSPVGYWRSEQSYFTDNWLVNNSALSNYSTRSFNFDGVDTSIQITPLDIDTTNDLTLSCWVKSNGFTTWDYLCTNGGTSGTNSLLNLRFSGAGALYSNFLGGSVYTGLNGFADGNWHHIAMTINYTTGDVKFYKDGVVSATVLTFGSYGGSTRIASIGAINSAGAGSMSGNIDEFAIFQGLQNISDLYNGGEPARIEGAVAHWRMGEDATFNTNWNVPDQVGSNTGTSANMTISNLQGEAPNYTGGGLSANMTIEDRVGEAPNSTSNAVSFNMDEVDRESDVPT